MHQANAALCFVNGGNPHAAEFVYDGLIGAGDVSDGNGFVHTVFLAGIYNGGTL
jgi:hypothetical protein